MKKKPINTYFDEALQVFVEVYAEKPTKRRLWQKNDTFYSTQMRIPDGSCFAMFSRKAGKA